MASELLVGCAEADITPPLGVSLCGYFADRKAEGVLDPLLAHAVVVQAGDQAVALVSCDLIFPSRRVTARVREVVAARTCVPGPNVLVHCTHTHTGPMVDRQFLPDDDGYDKRISHGRGHEAYLDLLPEQIASAVCEAARNLAPTQGVGWGVGKEETIAFNRRYHMRDGSVRTNPGRLNPDIVKPAGPVDPTVTVVAFGPGSPVLVNFAVHQDITGGCMISADMPCHMKRVLRGALGGDVLPVYLNGCCGDINHIDVARETGDGYEHSVLMGHVLAGEAIKTLAWIETQPVDTVAAASTTLDIPLRTVTPEELAQAEELLAAQNGPIEWPETTEVEDEEGFRLLQVLWAHGTVALAKSRTESLSAEVQALRIGPVGVVGLPGEIFTEHGLAIQERSPFPVTLVVELANEWHGYVPTQRAFAEGGYETQHRSAKLCEDAGDRMVDAGVKLLERLAE